MDGPERLNRSTIEQLTSTRGLSATVSDVLDHLGWNLAVPATVVAPRHSHAATVVGYAVTSEYLPARQRSRRRDDADSDRAAAPPPAFDPGYRLGEKGDVLVLAAHGLDAISVFGGRVARLTSAAGIGGVVVDGAIRDVDELYATGLPVWSRGLTPITGKGRLEQIATNRPVCFAGVQVRPGDLVVADASGVCFVPPQIASTVALSVLRVAAAELAAETG